MAVTVPLFAISIALSLLAIRAVVSDRRAWARRRAAAAEALPQAPSPGEVDLGQPSLGPQAAAAPDWPAVPPLVAAAPAIDRIPAHAPARAPARAPAFMPPRSLALPPAARPVPPPFAPAGRPWLDELKTPALPVSGRARARAAGSIPPRSRFSADLSTDAVTTVSPRAAAAQALAAARAPALASLPPPAPPGASPHARGTPLPRALSSQPSVPSWPIIRPSPSPAARRRPPGR
jgi:hypothetical protein